MEPKKSYKADLENKKGIFLQIGLVVVLGLTFFAFEMKSKPANESTLGIRKDIKVDEEFVPITRQQELTPPPPPPPPQVINVINIVSNQMDDDDSNPFWDDDDDNLNLNTIEYGEQGSDEEEVFIIVEKMPSFKGEGSEGFRKYITENLRYPAIAAENGIQGRVFVQFAINSKGEIVDVKVVRGVDPSLDAEAARVIKSSPKWQPGEQRGKPVKVQFTFPVNFVLQ